MNPSANSINLWSIDYFETVHKIISSVFFFY